MSQFQKVNFRKSKFVAISETKVQERFVDEQRFAILAPIEICENLKIRKKRKECSRDVMDT